MLCQNKRMAPHFCIPFHLRTHFILKKKKTALFGDEIKTNARAALISLRVHDKSLSHSALPHYALSPEAPRCYLDNVWPLRRPVCARSRRSGHKWILIAGTVHWRLGVAPAATRGAACHCLIDKAVSVPGAAGAPLRRAHQPLPRGVCRGSR